jgi:hypothetical protein
MATYSVNWSAVLSTTATDVAVGDVLVRYNGTPTYVVATTANRGTLRSTGVAATAGSAGGVVQLIEAGTIEPALSGLAASTQSWVRVSSSGRLERVAVPATGDDIIGKAEADGSVHLQPGVWDSTNIAGAGIPSPSGTGVVTVTGGVQDAAATAPGTAGNLLTSTGTAWASAAPAGVMATAGTTTELQYRVSASALGAASTMTWDAGTSRVNVAHGGMQIRDGSDSYYYRIMGGTLAANRELSLPALPWNEILVCEGTTQSLSNKTLVSPAVTGTLTSSAGLALFNAQGGGWKDVIGRAVARTTGATVATFEQIGATVFYANKFDLNDEMWFELHIPHDFEGSNIYLHAHWVASGTNANAVKWQFDWTTAKGYGRGEFNFASPTTDYATTTPGGSTAQYRHFISETAAQNSANYEIDGLVMVRLKRITNGATDNTDSIYLLFCDAHYQSNGSPTLNRNYPFA